MGFNSGFKGLIKFWRNWQFLSALNVTVLGYIEMFVSTRRTGVASREVAALTQSDAGPMYENVTGFYATCRESNAIDFV